VVLVEKRPERAGKFILRESRMGGKTAGTVKIAGIDSRNTRTMARPVPEGVRATRLRGEILPITRKLARARSV